MNSTPRLRRTQIDRATGTSPRVIIVDNDRAVRRSFTLLLTIKGFDVTTRSTAAQALTHRPGRNDALLVSYLMPKLDGLTLLIHLRCDGWLGAAVLMTGCRDPGLLHRMASAPDVTLLEKPVAPAILIDAIRTPPRQHATGASWEMGNA